MPKTRKSEFGVSICGTFRAHSLQRWFAVYRRKACGEPRLDGCRE